MATHLDIDDALIEQARDIGGLTTKKAVVTQALLEYIQRRRQHKLIELFGSVQYDPDYDYKARRKAQAKPQGKRGNADPSLSA